MVTTFLQGMLLLIAKKHNATSLMSGLTVEKFYQEAAKIEDMGRKYETIRKELNKLIKEGLLIKGLPINNLNTYSLTKEGEQEIERICKK